MDLKRVEDKLDEINKKVNSIGDKLSDSLNKGVFSVSDGVNKGLNNLDSSLNKVIEKHLPSKIKMEKEKPFNEFEVSTLGNNSELKVDNIIRNPINEDSKKGDNNE